MNINRLSTIFFVFFVLLLISAAIWMVVDQSQKINSLKNFNGEKALDNVRFQVSLGPRLPGSDAHHQLVRWLEQELKSYGWDVEIQNGMMMNHSIQNVIARRGTGSRWIILGAHYDTRMIADKDSKANLKQLPVPGANDGASGVAVLLELARILPANTDMNVWLVFFDAEDNGGIRGWDWILGSRYFAQGINCCPEAVVIVDMVGGANLSLYKERTSDINITNQIWSKANELGLSSVFLPRTKYKVIDDQTPFLELGMKAVDIIDMDYPYWHTTNDTIDKISAKSLQEVGSTLFLWLKQP
jgi:glutaminyl-peptide cyclotransferase